MNVYVSTSAIESPFDLEKVLQAYDEMCLMNIELGSSHKYCSSLDDVLKKYKHMNFVVHNYFPPPVKPFALNLSSMDEQVQRASIKHAKHAIDLCVEIRSPIYSIHAGMVANPRKIEFFEGFTFDEMNVNQEIYELCFTKMVESCKEINEYAKQKGIKFAVENSGGHPNKYKYLMMTMQHEFERLMDEIKDDNFGILLDVGHFNISVAVYPEECMETFIQRFKNKIFQVHVHHNDGSNDQHLPPTEKELNLLSSFSAGTIIVLESMKNKRDDILIAIANMNNHMNSII